MSPSPVSAFSSNSSFVVMEKQIRWEPFLVEIGRLMP